MSASGRFGVNFANRMPKSARGKKMNKASLSTGNGPGSSIVLAPETIRVRDALIEKFNGAPLEEMNNFMTMALSNETDELRRLGVLAARIYILRTRVANLKEFNRDLSLASFPALDTTTLNLNLPRSADPIVEDDSEATSESDQWSRIKMTEPGEVNGVRFLAGTIIDAQTRDADKLIRSSKAVRVDMDGNVIDNHDDDYTDSDTPLNSGDEAVQALVDDASAPNASDNDSSVRAVLNNASLSDDQQEASITDGDAEVDADFEAGVTEDEAKMAKTADENPKA